MKASPQRAREKRVTRAIVVTQSICVKWKGGEGNLKRSALKTATPEQEILHKNLGKLVRKTSEKDVQIAHFLQEVCWENMLTRNLGRQSNRNHSLCFTENKNGQRNKTPGRTGCGPCLQDSGPDETLDRILRNSAPYTLKGANSRENVNPSNTRSEILGSLLHPDPHRRYKPDYAFVLPPPRWALCPLQFLLPRTVFFHSPPSLIASLTLLRGQQHPDLALW